VNSGTGGSYKEVIRTLGYDQNKIDLTQYIRENGRMFDEVENDYSLPLGKVPSTLMLKLIAELEGFVDTNQCGVMERLQ